MDTKMIYIFERDRTTCLEDDQFGFIVNRDGETNT